MKIFLAIAISSLMLMANETSVDRAKEVAFEASHKLHEMMSSNLKSTIKEKGLVAGVQFCLNDSLFKIKELNKTLGDSVSLKRISLRNRNPNSYPQDDEKKILEAFDLIEKSNSFLPKEITQLLEDGSYKVYMPVTMSNKSCQSCHGDKEKFDTEVKSLIQKKYPNDNAFGFLSGQVRGAVVVTVKIKE